MDWTLTEEVFSLGFTTTSHVSAGVMLLAGITFGATGSYKIISLGYLICYGIHLLFTCLHQPICLRWPTCKNKLTSSDVTLGVVIISFVRLCLHCDSLVDLEAASLDSSLVRVLFV